MFQIRISKTEKLVQFRKFGYLNFEIACPVKYALSYFWLMDCDPSGKGKSSVLGKII
jgi:hypothetical protein